MPKYRPALFGGAIEPIQLPKYDDAFSSNDQIDVATRQKIETQPQMQLQQQPQLQFQMQQKPQQLQQKQMGPPALFEFKINDKQVYPPPPPRPPQDPFKKLVDQGIYPNTMVPMPLHSREDVMYNMVPPVVIKNNNIRVDGFGEYERLPAIYEDMLPTVDGIV